MAQYMSKGCLLISSTNMGDGIFRLHFCLSVECDRKKNAVYTEMKNLKTIHC